VKRLPPAWFLFLFAPLTVEYVSGSSPNLNPILLLANLLLYGIGTLLIRELRVRWSKGWLSVFVLAAAYMVAEEGLMLNTLFDPHNNTTGRALGVNWVWTAGMLEAHSLFSIFMPILLAEAIYDQHANASWIKPRTCWILLAAFLANVFGLGHLIAPLNRPGAIYYLLELAFIALCLALARFAPTPRSATATPERSPIRLYVTTLAGIAVTMLISFAAPTLAIPAAAKIAVMLLFYLAFLGLLRRNGTFRAGLNPLSKFAVASGMISFWIILSPLASIAKHNLGPASFGALTVFLLFRMLQRLKANLPVPTATGPQAV